MDRQFFQEVSLPALDGPARHQVRQFEVPHAATFSGNLSATSSDSRGYFGSYYEFPASLSTHVDRFIIWCGSLSIISLLIVLACLR